MSLANCLIQIGKPPDALQDLTDNLMCIATPGAKAMIYKGIADVHEAMGNKMLRAIALQKVLQFSPEETDALFSAAHALNEVEIPTLSSIKLQYFATVQTQ